MYTEMITLLLYLQSHGEINFISKIISKILSRAYLSVEMSPSSRRKVGPLQNLIPDKQYRCWVFPAVPGVYFGYIPRLNSAEWPRGGFASRIRTKKILTYYNC